MRLTATEPLKIDINGEVQLVNPGDIFDLPDDRAERARPYIEEGILKPVDPVEELDRFFTSEILPRLSRLHKAGRVPNLAGCPAWEGVDRLWQEPTPDVKKVKGAMETALKTYEKPDSLF